MGRCSFTYLAVLILGVVVSKVPMVVVPNESEIPMVPLLSKISIVNFYDQKDVRPVLPEFFVQFRGVPKTTVLILQRPRITSTEKGILRSRNANRSV